MQKVEVMKDCTLYQAHNFLQSLVYYHKNIGNNMKEKSEIVSFQILPTEENTYDVIAVINLTTYESYSTIPYGGQI